MSNPTCNPSALPARIRDWQPLRDAFIKRSPRPTYGELSTEFGIPHGTIGVCAAEEAWPALRSAYLDKQLEEADAKSALLAAVSGDRTVTRKFLNLAIVALDKLTQTVERMDDGKSASTNAQTVNTCMFAAANLAKALHEVGIVGISKTLNQVGKEDNGRWDPKLLTQINVTVQNLQDKKADPILNELEKLPSSDANGVKTENESKP
jgi:hypothetical protein